MPEGVKDCSGVSPVGFIWEVMRSFNPLKGMGREAELQELLEEELAFPRSR